MDVPADALAGEGEPHPTDLPLWNSPDKGRDFGGPFDEKGHRVSIRIHPMPSVDFRGRDHFNVVRCDIEHQNVGPVELHEGAIANLRGVRARVKPDSEFSIAHDNAMHALAPVHLAANGALLERWRFTWPAPEHGQVENPLHITLLGDWDEILWSCLREDTVIGSMGLPRRNDRSGNGADTAAG